MDKIKTTKKTDKSKQIVHEAEITRQHARYKIPAKIEIDGKIYKLEDWSVSGCAIEDLPDEVLHKKFVVGKMIFRFDDFETIVDNIKIEFISRRPNGVVGGRFTELTPQQISILNQIISSFLAGDIITEDDIIHAVTRTITYEKKEKPKVEKKKSILILIIVYSVVILLISFLAYVMYKRIYVVPTENAFIDSNITVIRAPAPSYVHYPKKIKVGDKVKKGEGLLSAYLVAGGVQKIASPIDGEILKKFALNGEFRNVAEPILYILHNDNFIYITAHVLHKNLIKLRIGDIATIVTPDGQKFYAKLVKITPAQTVYQKKTKKFLENIYNKARDYDTLTFYTNYTLTKKMINRSVVVTIDTFLNRHGLLSLDDNEIKNVRNAKYPNNEKMINKIKKADNEDNYYKKIEVENVKSRDENEYRKDDRNKYRDRYENEYAKKEHQKYREKRYKEYNYCVVVESDKYLEQESVRRFFRLFPNGKVDKYSNMYVFNIPGFTDYNSAKSFIRRKVKKYYKDAFVRKCGSRK
jgi:alginate biosynthesis protein Alg44